MYNSHNNKWSLPQQLTLFNIKLLIRQLTSGTRVDLCHTIDRWSYTSSPLQTFATTVHLCIDSSPLFDILPLTSAKWLTTATKIDLCNKSWPLPQKFTFATKVDLYYKSWPLLQQLTFASIVDHSTLSYQRCYRLVLGHVTLSDML